MVLSLREVFEITGLCVNKPKCRVLMAIEWRAGRKESVSVLACDSGEAV